MVTTGVVSFAHAHGIVGEVDIAVVAEECLICQYVILWLVRGLLIFRHVCDRRVDVCHVVAVSSSSFEELKIQEI